MTEKQIPKLMGTFVEHMSCFNALSTEEVDWVMKGKQKEVMGVCVTAIKRHRLLKIFKPIFADRILTIEARDGQRNIYDSRSVFKGGLSENFKHCGLNRPGKPTNEIHPVVYGLQEDDFRLTDNWDKFFTQDQVIEFCIKYSEFLSSESLTLFPIEQDGIHFAIYVNSVLSAGVYNFNDGYHPRPVEPRLYMVVPQPLVS